MHLESNGPSLERREELAQAGLVSVEADDGTVVPIDDCFVCPDACGKVFESENSYNDFCPDQCEAQLGYLKAAMDAAVDQETFTVYILFDKNKQAIKVCDDLIEAQQRWWWSSVKQMVVLHYEREEEALEAQERILQSLRPLYDLQPNAIGQPAPLSPLPPDPDAGAKTEPVAFKVTPEEDVRISVAAEKAGMSRSEWLRQAVRLTP